MNTDQNRVKWEGFFSIILLPGWEYTQEQDVVNLFKKTHGVGSLQLSFARRHRKGDTNIQEALELTESFITNRNWKIDRENIHQLEIDGCPATEFAFVEPNEESRYWHVWHIVSNTRVVFITYNCENDDANFELNASQTIVQSFQWEHELQ